MTLSNGFFGVFNSTWLLKFSSQLEVFWRAGFLEAIYSIWYAHNRAIFHTDFVPIQVVIRKICKAISDASVFKLGFMVNTQFNLNILRCLRIHGIVRCSPIIFGVCWFPPSSGWLKLNTDEAARGAPGLAGVDGAFRDHLGSTVTSFWPH